MRTYLVTVGHTSVAVEPHDSDTTELSSLGESMAELVDDQLHSFILDMRWNLDDVQVLAAGWNGDTVKAICRATCAADFLGE